MPAPVVGDVVGFVDAGSETVAALFVVVFVVDAAVSVAAADFATVAAPDLAIAVVGMANFVVADLLPVG